MNLTSGLQPSVSLQSTNFTTVVDNDDNTFLSSAHQYSVNQSYVMWTFCSSCFILLLAVFGTCSNVVCARVFLHPKMRQPINFLLVALCGIDTAVVLSAVPLMGFNGLNIYIESSLLQAVIEYSVLIIYPLAMVAKTCSVWIFVLITFERYLAVCHPFKARALFFSNRQAYIAVFMVVIMSLLYNLVRFWEYTLEFNDDGKPSAVLHLRSNQLYKEALNRQLNKLNFGHLCPVPEMMHARSLFLFGHVPGTCFSQFSASVYYTGLYLFVNFLYPFITLIVLNVKICQTIAEADRLRKTLSRQDNREYRTARMLVVVVLVFLATNTLPFVMNVVEAFYQDFFSQPSTQLLATILIDISNLLVVINSATTIFIYYFCSSKFRFLLRSQLKPKRRRLRSTVPQMASAASLESIKDLLEPSPLEQVFAFFKSFGFRIAANPPRTNWSCARTNSSSLLRQPVSPQLIKQASNGCIQN